MFSLILTPCRGRVRLRRGESPVFRCGRKMRDGTRWLLYHDRHMPCGRAAMPRNIYHSHGEKATRSVCLRISYVDRAHRPLSPCVSLVQLYLCQSGGLLSHEKSSHYTVVMTLISLWKRRRADTARAQKMEHRRLAS